MDAVTLKTSVALLFCFVLQLICFRATEPLGKLRNLFFIAPGLPHFLLFSKGALTKAKSILENHRNEKRLLVDFPFLIENLRSCLKAGINIGPAIELLASNPLWSPLLRNPLCKASQCRATGMSLKDSLTTAQKTVGSTGGERYVRQLFSSIILGQASGGDLLGLIKKVQEKSVTAIQLQRRANVLTAQMRFQSLVITLAPLAIGVTIYLFDPNRILFFFKDSRGQFLLVLMITFNIVGAKILNKISKVA